MKIFNFNTDSLKQKDKKKFENFSNGLKSDEATPDILETNNEQTLIEHLTTQNTITEEKNNPENKIITFLKTNKRYLIPLSIIFISLITGVILYININSLNSSKNVTKPLISVPENYISAFKPDNKNDFPFNFTDFLAFDVPAEPKTQLNPFNGVLYSTSEITEFLKRKPIAIQYDNYKVARPLSGIQDAEIIIESPQETGTTSILAIFWSKSPSETGPITSSRQHFLEWISVYDAIYSHESCTSSDDSRVDSCANTISYGIKDAENYSNWIDNSASRTPPHNEYVSLSEIWLYAEGKSWSSFSPFTSWKFKNDAKHEELGNMTSIKIEFIKDSTSSSDYNVEWFYNRNSNSYLRTVGGNDDKDKLTNSQISAKSIIVQEVTYTQLNDNNYNVIVQTIGDGKGKLFIDGKSYSIIWSKKDRKSPTLYYFEDENEITLNRGLIWIELLPKEQGRLVIN